MSSMVTDGRNSISRSGAVQYSLMLLAVMAFYPAVSPAEESADVQTYSATFNFGCVPQKAEVSHTFFVANYGSTPLTVTKVKPGCSCTSVSEIDRPIQPGDSVPFIVTFQSGRYFNRVHKTTEVYTDAAVEYRFSLIAKVIKRGDPAGKVKFSSPVAIWHATNGRKGTVSDTLRLSNTGGSDLNCELVYAPTSLACALDLPKRLPAGQTVPLTVSSAEPDTLSTRRGLCIVVRFVGSDTTLATIPIEIDD